jgi:MFS family permease
MKAITRTIWILSLVSLFTDVASEMLYPVMPVYLKSINFSVLLIGVLEGFAEATAGFSKGYFGNLSDNTGKRLPFVRWGYSLSAISKPMMAMFTFPLWIFSARAMDRLGKGIRTGARDAILSDESTAENKGRVFGFHRAMDTFGAVAGPSLALVFLLFFPGEYKTLFLLAFLPGVIAIGFTFLLKDKKGTSIRKKAGTRFTDFLKYWHNSPAAYRKLLIGLLFFTLFNSSDVFLLLKIKEAGYSDLYTIGAYIFYNIVYALFAYPLGILADRLGMKNILCFGLIIFAVVYGGMAWNRSFAGFLLLFFMYGVYAASTEGVAKALISNIADRKDTATAIGTFTSFQSICTLLASSIAGLIWYQFGPAIIFLAAAIAAVLAVIYFLAIGKSLQPGKPA